MASLHNESNGRRNIRFILPGETTRKKISLGKISKKNARTILTKVEALIESHITQLPMDSETSQWVAGLTDDLYDRIARTGILTKREQAEGLTIKQAAEKFYAMRQDVKDETRIKWKQGHGKLMEFLGETRPMADITEVNAEEFEQWLIGKSYATGTYRKHIAVCKVLWRWAIKRGYAASNVFAGLKSTAVAGRDKQFITRDQIEKVIEACPNAQWRLIVALARYGGLRVPSELAPLKWGDVDWARRRLRITSPKTEHHEGKGERIMPIFPELMPHLQRAFDEAEEGTEHIITTFELRRSTNAYLRKVMRQTIRKAGLEPWPRIFQNLRSSCQTELTQKYGWDVCNWLGNSQAVAQKHYLQPSEELMDRAAGFDPEADQMGQNLGQSGAATGGNGQNPKTKTPGFTGDFRDLLIGAGSQVPPQGLEP
ncbi:site-specific integrase [Planctomycetales bacterium ZRK34]|nr:site-specific integrase [Planctomycetales bacterium ZRK34]